MKVFLIIIALVSMVFLAGCSGKFNHWFEQNNSALEFAVKAAVVQLITDEQVEKERILELTAMAKGFVEANPTARAEVIVGKVKDEIKWDKLNPGQTVLAVTLLDVIQTKIQERIDEGAIKDDTSANVLEIIGWIEAGANMT